MGPKTKELSNTLSRLEQVLLANGEQDWAHWILSSNKKIQDGNFHGITKFLGAFGGMGSLNDVVLANSDSDESFRSLKSEAYDLATSIKSDQ